MLPCIEHATGHQQLILHYLHDLIAGLRAAFRRSNDCDCLLRSEREKRERKRVRERERERERERVSLHIHCCNYSNYS